MTIPFHVRPLDGPGARNFASSIRAPLDSGPIDPMREPRRDRWLGPIAAVLGAAFICWMVWELVK